MIFWEGVVILKVLKELIFQQFPLWEGVVVLERTDLIIVDTLGGCSDLGKN